MFKKSIVKFGSLVASLALMLGVFSTSTSCWMIFHQPKEPEGMKKYKK